MYLPQTSILFLQALEPVFYIVAIIVVLNLVLKLIRH